MAAGVLWLSAQGRNASDCQPTEAYLQTASALSSDSGGGSVCVNSEK